MGRDFLTGMPRSPQTLGMPAATRQGVTTPSGSVLFTTVGANSFPVPTGVSRVRYLIVGGGEGVGNNKGGGAGYVVAGETSVWAGDTVPVTVGAGGASQAVGTSGAPGGTSAFGSFASAPGGGSTTHSNGGSGGGGARTGGAAGNGGSNGSSGTQGSGSSNPGGSGQGTPLPLSGFKYATFTAGAGGTGYPAGGGSGGGGGGGGVVTSLTTNPTAGTGATGGTGGTGFGAGGGAACDSIGPGGAGTSGLVYLEWG